MLRRTVAVVSLALAVTAAVAGPAIAHTDLEPEQAVAGSTETLTFHVAYEGAGTTGLDVQLPEGAAVLQVPPKPGWTSRSDPEQRTVSWEGGPIDADEEFEVVVELPGTTGVVLFPAVQRTTEGEVPWISEEDDGEGHDGNPAPRLTLVPDPEAGSTSSTTTTTEPSTTTSRERPGTTLEAANEGDGDSAAPWLIGSGVAAIVAIAAGGYLLKRRMG